MIDENAFGILLSYFMIEDNEYSLEPSAFEERFEAFRDATRAALAAAPFASCLRVLDLGHAVYAELAEDDAEQTEWIVWLKASRASLSEAGFDSAIVLTHGGRWVTDAGPCPVEHEDLDGLPWCRISPPSEPFRKALEADAASRLMDDDDAEGWGPGVYVDTEALEAIGKSPKNAPTALRGGTGTFYRVAR